MFRGGGRVTCLPLLQNAWSLQSHQLRRTWRNSQEFVQMNVNCKIEKRSRIGKGRRNG